MGDSSANIDRTARLTRILSNLNGTSQSLDLIARRQVTSKDSPPPLVSTSFRDLSIEQLRLSLRYHVQRESPWLEMADVLHEIVRHSGEALDVASAMELAVAYGEWNGAIEILCMWMPEDRLCVITSLMDPVRDALGKSLFFRRDLKLSVPPLVWDLLGMMAGSEKLRFYEALALWIQWLEAGDSRMIRSLKASFWDFLLVAHDDEPVMRQISAATAVTRTAQILCESGQYSLARRVLENGGALAAAEEEVSTFLFNIRHAEDEGLIFEGDAKEFLAPQHPRAPRIEKSTLIPSLWEGAGDLQSQHQKSRVKAFVSRQGEFRVDQLAALAQLECDEGRMAGAVEAWSELALRYSFRNVDLEDMAILADRFPGLRLVKDLCLELLSDRRNRWQDLSKAGGSKNPTQKVRRSRAPDHALIANLLHFVAASPLPKENDASNQAIEPAFITVSSELVRRVASGADRGFWPLLQEAMAKTGGIADLGPAAGSMPVPEFLQKLPFTEWGQILAMVCASTKNSPCWNGPGRSDRLDLLGVLAAAALAPNALEFVSGLRTVAPVWLVWRLENWLLTEELRFCGANI